MLKKILFLLLLLISRTGLAQAGDYFNAPFGELLAGSTDKVGLWRASSGWKISRDKSLPVEKSEAIMIQAARNEAEAAQLVVRPTVPLSGFTARAGDLSGPGGAVISSESVEILKVRYVNVERPTDKSSIPGPWPDPLPLLKGTMDLEPNKNQPFWIRVKVPRSAPAGIYMGSIELDEQDYNVKVTLRVEVYVYWFDEPAPRDYEFVMNGFRKLRDAAPDINRMLTEHVEPNLIGGPDIWCEISELSRL